MNRLISIAILLVVKLYKRVRQTQTPAKPRIRINLLAPRSVRVPAPLPTRVPTRAPTRTPPSTVGNPTQTVCEVRLSATATTQTSPATDQSAEKSWLKEHAVACFAGALALLGLTMIVYGWTSLSATPNGFASVKAALALMALVVLLLAFLTLTAKNKRQGSTTSQQPRPAVPPSPTPQTPAVVVAQATTTRTSAWSAAKSVLGTAAALAFVVFVLWLGWLWFGTTQSEKLRRLESVRSLSPTPPLRTMDVLVTSEWSDAIMIPSGERIRWTRRDRTVPYEVRTSTERTPVEIAGAVNTSLIDRRRFRDTESVQFRTTNPNMKEVWMKIEFFPY